MTQMTKLLTVAALTAALTGCVTYTNSSGERCTTSLDPLAWIMTGVNAVGAGVDSTEMVHRCERKGK